MNTSHPPPQPSTGICWLPWGHRFLSLPLVSLNICSYACLLGAPLFFVRVQKPATKSVLVCLGCSYKVPHPHGFWNRILFSPGSGGQKPDINVPAWLVPSESHGESRCSRPLSGACRWLSSSCLVTSSSLGVSLSGSTFPLFIRTLVLLH